MYISDKSAGESILSILNTNGTCGTGHIHSFFELFDGLQGHLHLVGRNVDPRHMDPRLSQNREGGTPLIGGEFQQMCKILVRILDVGFSRFKGFYKVPIEFEERVKSLFGLVVKLVAVKTSLYFPTVQF